MKTGSTRRKSFGARERNSNKPISTHLWRWHWDSNLGHIGGRRVLLPLCHPCFTDIVWFLVACLHVFHLWQRLFYCYKTAYNIMWHTHNLWVSVEGWIDIWWGNCKKDCLQILDLQRLTSLYLDKTKHWSITYINWFYLHVVSLTK